ncbi:MAG: transglycosylase SLT domain-containing protein [Chitinispirillia bacterium]|nr:transglycosylase SLT domain-containing protein [Chitinispirillia bacterium]MCL2269367.1 transglycosylase SLT domain-containing protein [Chitinispirillia bacterium]
MLRNQNATDTQEQPGAGPQQAAASSARHGIAIEGNRIWMSELTCIILVCILIVALFSMTAVIIHNEHTIHKHDDKIAQFEMEKISVTRDVNIMKERLRIVELLKVVIGRKSHPEWVYKLADLVYTNSLQYGYSPELLLGLIAVESKYDPEALGRYRSGALSDAVGLMQIKYPTALDMAKVLGIEGLKPEDLMNPEMNIILGTAYLTTLISWFKDFKVGVMAYNLGPGTVRGVLRRNETLPIEYYEKILVQYYRLKALGEQIDITKDTGW